MKDERLPYSNKETLSRRSFLGTIGKGMAGGVLAGFAIGMEGAFAGKAPPEVKRRRLGRTGLMVSEIGFGGHSWSYAQVPDGDKMRVASEKEALDMIRTGLEMGVNFFDSDSPHLEHTVPGKAVKRLNARKEVIVCARLVHKMKGQAFDREKVYRFVDERLKMWQTDYFDIFFKGMTTEDYWDMSYCIEALEKVKKAGKCRFMPPPCQRGLAAPSDLAEFEAPCEVVAALSDEKARYASMRGG